MSAPLPSNEALRLEVLNRYAVMDTPPEEQFDRLSRLAARVFRTPIALISLVDERRQWFKACYGVDANGTDRKLAFCAYTILSDEVMVVEDATKDPRFCDNALVKGPPGIRFYAGAPLLTREGVSIGAICVIDSVPRQFSPAERASLEDLAAMVVDELDLREKTSLMAAEITRRTEAEIELREAKAELDRKNDDLRESQQHLNALLDNAPAIIYSKDLEGRYLVFNRPHTEILGKARKEIAGRLDSELFPPELAEVFRQHDREVINSGRTIEFEESAHVQGELHVFHSVKFPLRDENGEIYATCGISTDITERKRADDELRKSRDEAERANRAKSEFLSRMSHELRTPLNAILGFGQLLERASLSPRQAESVAQITKAGRHLLELINEVLDLSRIEAGRMPLSLEAVNAAELVREASCLLKPLCEERGIRMMELVCRDYWVLADRQKLRQVLLNLLSNAVKYNKLGGTVEVRFEETGLKRLNISITDTGFGIGAEKLEKIFTPFERLGAEHTGIEGSGIGLALSKRLLELMGGTLEVQSTLNRGSTFTIRLPSTSEPGEPTAALIELPSTREKGVQSAVRRPVLYVEDNPANLRLMERILEGREDILLYTCNRGDEALQVVREYRPQLILLDLHLPGLDGEQILRSLRCEPEFQAIPVVIISADAMSAQVKRLLASGANEYITKPIRISEILEMLSKYLDQPISIL